MYRLYIRKFTKAVTCVCLLVAMMFSFFFTATSFSASSKGKSCYEQTAKHLSSQTPVGVSSIGGEWLVIGLARGNCAVSKNYYSDYREKVIEIIKEKDGVLSSSKYSEYSRVILALTAIGEDVTDVGGYNLLSYLSDFSKVKRQGVNGPIWTLIALDSNNYAIPKCENSDNTTRDKLIDYILGKGLSSGGWAIAGNTPDPDVTAMAITALSKYYNSNKEVKSAIDKGITVLSDIQKSSGNFSSGGVVNCESVAQVIVCLSSLGINPNTDKRFICDGKSLVDVLLSFSVSGGGFVHQQGGEYNQMATEQGFYALVAYNRLLSDKTSLFDMIDVFTSNNTVGENNVEGNKTALSNSTQHSGNKANKDNDKYYISKNTESNNGESNKDNYYAGGYNIEESESYSKKNETENDLSKNKEVTKDSGEKSGGSVLSIANKSKNKNSNKPTDNSSVKTTTDPTQKNNYNDTKENSKNSLQNEEQQNNLDDNSQKQNDEKKQCKDSGIVVCIIGVAILLALGAIVFIVLKKRKSKAVKGEK